MLLVTGAAGFVGSRVVAIARQRGLAVRGLARRPGPGVDHAVDLAEEAALRRLPLDEVEAIVHCAAATPARSKAFERDNEQAARALAAVRGGRRVVHVSSVSVYVRPAQGDWTIDEAAEVVHPESAADAYARSKRAVELALGEHDTVHLRASSIYGAGMVTTTLLPVLVARARRGEDLVLRGPRGYVQNFVHVDDVAELALAALDGGESVINAFSDDTLVLLELADLVRTTLESRSVVVDETTSVAYPRPRFVNARARSLHPRFRALREHLAEIA